MAQDDSDDRAHTPAAARKLSILERILQRSSIAQHSNAAVKRTDSVASESVIADPPRRPSASRAQLCPYVLITPQARQGVSHRDFVFTEHLDEDEPPSRIQSEPVSPLTTEPPGLKNDETPTCTRKQTIHFPTKEEAIAALPPLTRMKRARPLIEMESPIAEEESLSASDPLEPMTDYFSPPTYGSSDPVSRNLHHGPQPAPKTGIPHPIPHSPSDPPSKRQRMRLAPIAPWDPNYSLRPSIVAAIAAWPYPAPPICRDPEPFEGDIAEGTTEEVPWHHTLSNSKSFHSSTSTPRKSTLARLHSVIRCRITRKPRKSTDQPCPVGDDEVDSIPPSPELTPDEDSPAQSEEELRLPSPLCTSPTPLARLEVPGLTEAMRPWSLGPAVLEAMNLRDGWEEGFRLASVEVQPGCDMEHAERMMGPIDEEAGAVVVEDVVRMAVRMVRVDEEREIGLDEARDDVTVHLEEDESERAARIDSANGVEMASQVKAVTAQDGVVGSRIDV